MNDLKQMLLLAMAVFLVVVTIGSGDILMLSIADRKEHKMVTNITAAVTVCIVTNWTDVFEQIDTYLHFLNCPVSLGSVVSLSSSSSYVSFFEHPDRYKNGKYLGKDGVVIELTEIKFNFKGVPQTHRIEKELRRITMRCHEKPPAAPELIWDEPIVWTNNVISLNNFTKSHIGILHGNGSSITSKMSEAHGSLSL